MRLCKRAGTRASGAAAFPSQSTYYRSTSTYYLLLDLDTSAVLPLASPPRRKVWPHARAQRWRQQNRAHRAAEVSWMVGLY